MTNDYFIPIYCILPKKCVVKEVFVSQRWIRDVHEPVREDHQFKGRYDAEKNAVIISLEKDEQSALSPQKCTT